MERARFERTLTAALSRRRVLDLGLAGAAAVSLPGRATAVPGGRDAGATLRRPQFSANPFGLGVASGDPLPEGVVLWTRLAPDPANGGGMEPAPVEVRWEVADDEAMTKIVATGAETATPDLAHSVHADVAGLRPDTGYFYRFTVGSEASPVGRTRTAPAADATPERLRFAFLSCANWEHGHFTAYGDVANQDLSFVAFLGDYIYEYGRESADFRNGSGAVRLVTGGEARTLEEYRTRHALYKTDQDLQVAHLAHPWIVTWDDHEVENDYAGDHSERGDPVDAFRARRAAAYQAYYEHMPLRAASLPTGPDMRLYRRFGFGRLLEMSVLDTRQYRTIQSCGKVGPRCAATFAPASTMTGPEQERWLLDGLGASTATWKTIAQQVMMAQLEVDFGSASPQFNQDQWDGYPAARNRILGHIRDAKVGNAIVLAGDIHSSWVGDLKADFADEKSPVVASEFVGPSVTSYNPFATQLGLLLPKNPHLKYYDARHGYVACDVTPTAWRSDYRAVETVDTPDAPVATIVSWVVEAGKAGVMKL
ncbi:MAG: alkaline phosphatase D family protein [Thermomicrobiales bacterium]